MDKREEDKVSGPKKQKDDSQRLCACALVCACLCVRVSVSVCVCVCVCVKEN